MRWKHPFTALASWFTARHYTTLQILRTDIKLLQPHCSLPFERIKCVSILIVNTINEPPQMDLKQSDFLIKKELNCSEFL